MAKTILSADMLNLGLKQLGATKVDMHTSKVTVVKFEITPTLTVSYFCHVKNEEKIYLQRIEPYPVRNYKFETVDNILSFIQKDVEQFANASNSSNFDKFLAIVNRNYAVRRDLEELFLLHNVPAADLEKILLEEEKVLATIAETEYTALKNDPGRFKGEEADLDDYFEIDQSLAETENVGELYGEIKKEEDTISTLVSVIEDLTNEVHELKKAINHAHHGHRK